MGPISSPLTAAAAHTQAMSVRELETMFSSTASASARPPLALGRDLALERLHGLGVFGCHGACLVQPLVARERQDHRAQLRQIGGLAGTAGARGRSPGAATAQGSAR